MIFRNRFFGEFKVNFSIFLLSTLKLRWFYCALNRNIQITKYRLLHLIINKMYALIILRRNKRLCFACIISITLGNYHVWTVESVIILKAQLWLHRMRVIVSKSLPHQELNLEFYLHLFSCDSTIVWRKFLEHIVRKNILKNIWFGRTRSNY